MNWLENVTVPWLYPDKDDLGNIISTTDSQLTAVFGLYRLGAPRLRQLRMDTGEFVTLDLMNNLILSEHFNLC